MYYLCPIAKFTLYNYSLLSELLLTSSFQPASYVPAIISEFSPEMTFMERLTNTYYKLGMWAYTKLSCMVTDWIGNVRIP